MDGLPTEINVQVDKAISWGVAATTAFQDSSPLLSDRPAEAPRQRTSPPHMEGSRFPHRPITPSQGRLRDAPTDGLLKGVVATVSSARVSSADSEPPLSPSRGTSPAADQGGGGGGGGRAEDIGADEQRNHDTRANGGLFPGGLDNSDGEVLSSRASTPRGERSGSAIAEDAAARAVMPVVAISAAATPAAVTAEREPAAEAPAGVVIRVCRKIGDKLRQSASEQAEHALIAVYARGPPAAAVSAGEADGVGHPGSDVGEMGSDEEGGWDANGGIAHDRIMGARSVHGEGVGWRRERGHRRGGERAGTRHILHTFRPQERLGEPRLGVSPATLGRGKDDQGAESSQARRRKLPDSRRQEKGYEANDDTEASDPADSSDGRQDAVGGNRYGKSVAGQARGGGLRQSLMWRSRWIYRDRRAPPLETDELQVEVSGSETSEDEAKAGWIDLWGLGQGHYCGYLLKKSRRDPSLWRRRWCILADDRLWLLRGKSDQSGRRRRRKTHSFSLSLVPCVVRAVSRSAAPSHCFELHAQSRVHLFRAESRAKQVAWVSNLQRQARQAAEDSFISVAEHMMCDEENARCRRLNDMLSSALGSRACEAVEGLSNLCEISRGGFWAMPTGPLPSTSGLFRRMPLVKVAPPADPNAVDCDGLNALQRWAYAADALEEFCPGSSDRSRWASTEADLVSDVAGEGRVSPILVVASPPAAIAAPAPRKLAPPEENTAVVSSSTSRSGDEQLRPSCASEPVDTRPAVSLATPARTEGVAACARVDATTPTKALPSAVTPASGVRMATRALAKPLVPASRDKVEAVARRIQEFRESVVAISSSRVRVGSGIAGALATGNGGSASPPAPSTPAAPPEALLDDLYEEVVRVFGDV